MNNNQKESGLAQGAYILMILATISFCIIPISLAWTIPMTLNAKKRITSYTPATGLGVCAIIFMPILGLIAGILLLCNNENSYTSLGTTSINQNQEVNNANVID
ncbi:hypothetical protein [Spiroplasma turonicum]|uniref:Uncharacterized protein n=1 Tax=Spiroplasma turonicum TaxID=216946 RepID=A0A0K1P6R5_9MOLU|nr:hypothetical protein [Spiroplasma turonicum]AKU79914.1 hypothetical protein STURON_00668 [Spiroplasma turonicum]ALX70926.1 hypothetical protein STURO_v1c06670 [Spiroplasma turonicum]